ncbi:MAG: hypothetical protein R2711_19185 [Acidimicrobiales bacterium]
MDPIRFTIYTAIGSLVWNGVLIGAGYRLGESWEQVAEWVGNVQYVVVAGLAALPDGGCGPGSAHGASSASRGARRFQPPTIRPSRSWRAPTTTRPS